MRTARLLITSVLALAGTSVLTTAASQAAQPGRPAGAANRVSIRFQLSGGTHGSASWSAPYHLIKKPDQFSGCAIISLPALHQRKLLVQIYPPSLDQFLTRRIKLTIQLSTSGGPVGLGSVAVVGYRGNLFENINATPHVTLKNGGRSGTFTVSGATNTGTQQGNVAIHASWSCGTLWHFTDTL